FPSFRTNFIFSGIAGDLQQAARLSCCPQTGENAYPPTQLKILSIARSRAIIVKLNSFFFNAYFKRTSIKAL
ncbi:MAG: hypothetical protein ACXWMF_12725, partial [Syntrophales bacterium]